jgi:hypothetical protein
LLQPLLERCYAGLTFGIIRGDWHEHADASHALALLRMPCKRPRSRRTAEKRDELAPLHVCPQAQESIVSAQTGTLIGVETGIKNIAAVHSQCRSWVKRGLVDQR